MKRLLLMALMALAHVYVASAQTKTVTTDANDILNNNTKLVAQTTAGQIFFTGHQIGSSYSFPSGIFRAITDNPTGATNFFYDGVTNGTVNFYARADGYGYFSGNFAVGTTNYPAKLNIYQQKALGGTAKNNTFLTSITGSSGSNNFQNNLWLVRNAAGSDWLTARLHDGISIDVSFLNPQTDTRTWWERDPYNNVQSWGNAANTYMSIVQGNVLIGKTTQQNSAYMLDVNGNMRANQIVINTTGADFVFEPAYHLIPLQAVKTFIDKNHHLPEMLPAAQMQADGLNVGDNQTKLLQKIEELTLYLIEKDKQVKQLQHDVQLLKKRKNNTISTMSSQP